MSKNHYAPVNPNSQECVKNVLNFLADISGKKVVTGQHTQNHAQEELSYIKSVTGKLPALVGFELLSYSPNINYSETDDECMEEVSQNYGTLKKAWEWAAQKGLITFTWHWFSPLKGKTKSFFAFNTEFDARNAVKSGTSENAAFTSDLDVMAGILRPFCEKSIPILWRPFHEAEGNWFWWGSGVCGAETSIKLYRLMYERFTKVHNLTNLIWVWNSPVPQNYPGDDVVDVISRDIYAKEHSHGSFKAEYDELLKITKAEKLCLIGENGTIPDINKVIKEKADWASFMTWSHEFCLTEKYTESKVLKEIYDSEFAVTKENLPVLY